MKIKVGFILGVVTISLLVAYHFMTRSTGNEKTETMYQLDGPDKAFLYDTYMTRDPKTNSVPHERLLEARKNKASYRTSGTNFNWQSIPTGIPGRARSFYYNTTSKILLSGSVTGGLWKNSDYKNNAQWELLEGFEGTSINRIIADPADENILYIGTGESYTAFVNYRESTGLGNGIYISKDGGATWDVIASTTNFYYINDLAIKMEGELSVLYAAVGSGEYRGRTYVQEGLYRSEDLGQNWTQVLPKISGSETIYQVSDVEIASNGRIYLGTMRNSENIGGSTILYSDDGTNWNIYSAFNESVLAIGNDYIPGRSIVKVAPSNSDHVYAIYSYGYSNDLSQLRDYYTELWQSVDGGANWSQIELVSNLFSLPWHALALAIDPNDENKIVAGGLELYVLNDASGAVTSLDWIRLSNWAAKFIAASPGLSQEQIDNYLARYVHADIHNIEFVANSSNDVLITTDGGVFYSSNMSLTNSIDPENPIQEFPVFGTATNGLNTTQFYYASIRQGKGDKQIVGGAQDNGSIYQNYAVGSEIEANISGGDGGYSFFDRDNEELTITTVYSNRYYIHIYGEGTYFTGIENGLFVNPMDYDDESNLLYSNTATSSYGGLYESLQGRYYDTLEILNINKYLKKPDLGLDTISFVKLNAGLDEAITAIRLDKSSDKLNKTAIIGTENGQVYKVKGLPYSPNTTKIDNNSLPIGYISSVDTGSDENTILVTISNYGLASVWYTNDGGTNWVNLERNLPDMPVRWGRINPFDDNGVIIATEVGIWGLENVADELTDWQTYNDGLPAIRIDMFDLRPSDKTILAATHGSGLYVGNYVQAEILGIEQENLANSAAVFYPNPAHNLISMDSRKYIADVQIYNLQGQLVLRSKPNAKNSINISSLQNGSYVVKTFDKKGNSIASQKMIKK